ncbi:unnamed protein product [Caenorhabditis angaria]|uniref:Mediator of RNA polymerase II transcription subunit 27 n=1 Tax=Caenorhabditis angaria TaxID=860376 RepID=A0A9P1J1X9_9PELO|nr:unnamed protein product [Caenorhabditis angaria]
MSAPLAVPQIPTSVTASAATSSATTTTVATTAPSAPTVTTASSSMPATTNPAENESATETSTSVTETSTSTTTTSTSSTSSTTTTTTTSTTATTAAPAAPSQAQINQQMLLQLHETAKQANNCLFYTRRLRAQMVNTQQQVLNLRFNKMRNKNHQNLYQRFERMMLEVKLTFERVENCCRKLPNTIQGFDTLNAMRYLYSEEHSMDHSNVTKSLEGMIDAGNWNEGQFQTFYYLSEFLRNSNNKRRTLFLHPRIIPQIHIPSSENAGHKNFENAFRGMKKEITSKSLGIYPRIVKTTSTGMVVEIKFGVAGPDKNDKNVVYTFKYLLIEKNGVIEYINVIAPNEELYMDCDFAEKSINATQPSRYKIYKTLTKQANLNLLNSFGTANRWTSTTLTQFVTIFGKMREIFGVKCNVCNKILRDFQPPMLFDIRFPGTAIHEHCK